VIEGALLEARLAPLTGRRAGWVTAMNSWARMKVEWVFITSAFEELLSEDG
jgi:hypothetical protein